MRVRCPACAARLKAPPTDRPRWSRCPRCEHRIHVAPLPPDETPADGTDKHNNLSAEVRALFRQVRESASEAGRKWLAKHYGAADLTDRERITEATHWLRVVHARHERGARVRRVPEHVIAEMAGLVESPAGDWMPSGKGATLREAFEWFQSANRQQEVPSGGG